MRQLIEQNDLQRQVNLVDNKVDIQGYYDTHHATILLCDQDGVIKNYPHSLMESICCDRPVILNSSIELSSMVDKHTLGVVLEDCTIHSLKESIAKLKTDYSQYHNNCKSFDTSLIDQVNYHDNLMRIYENVIKS